ncbi:MAG: biopolymer transporter ExbD [Bacteroidota bacterium]
MAYIQSSDRPKRSKSPKSHIKRKSTAIDMTAMVDVAFLLLTFFVLTSTLGSSSVMELVMPPKTGDLDPHLPVLEHKVMTLILTEDDQVDYYLGISNPIVGVASFDSHQENSLRKLVQGHLEGDGVLLPCPSGAKQRLHCWDPMFVIKPMEASSYKNLVDVLDEFAICGARKYAIDQYSVQDSLVMARN